MARLRTPEDVQRLLDARIPESGSLEYKRDLELGGRSQRIEALKDLTGMANGGGGTILYGVAEAPDGEPVPEALHPLTDMRVVGVLEDVVRSSVRPPLMWEYTTIAVEGGAVLVVDVEPSPLGPYMVEGYGEARYYHRSMTRTAPMSEQQVRDAYAIAARGQEHRAQLWNERALPMTVPTAGPWLTVSAVPEEPLTDIYDVTSVEPDALQPPQPLATHLQYSVSLALQRLGRWAQGYFGDDGFDDRPPREIVRVHRDGAAAIGTQLQTRVHSIFVCRQLNGMLAYLAWLWTEFELRRPIEVHVTLHNLNEIALDVGSMFGEGRSVREPPGVPVHQATIREHLLIPDLRRAGVRHRVVRRFADLLYQAFGLASCQPLFRSGALYGPDGRPLGVGVAGAGLWTGQPTAAAIVHEDGSVRSARSDRDVLGHLVEGAIVDPSGDTLAVIEMAAGAACPDEFLPPVLLQDPRAAVPGGNAGQPHPANASYPPPAPTGRWSDADLLALIRG